MLTNHYHENHNDYNDDVTRLVFYSDEKDNEKDNDIQNQADNIDDNDIIDDVIRIVLDCAAERIRDILMQAQQVGMMTGDLK